MNESELDDDVIRDYLAECREHLATIESDLLAIEQAGEGIDETLVNRVFRAAHSIKGGAGFFNLVNIRELAHKTESTLELIRSRQMVPSPDVVSILLLAFDKLRELIGQYRESNAADISDFIEALGRLAPSDRSQASRADDAEEEQPEVRDVTSMQLSMLDLSQGRKGGKSIYLIRYDLIGDIQLHEKTPWDVFRKIQEYGTILETRFDGESAGGLDDPPPDQLMVEVVYATVLEPDLVREVLDTSPENVWLIEPGGALRPLTEQPVAPVEPTPQVTAPAATPPAVGPPPATPAQNLGATASQAPSAVQGADATIRLNVALVDTLMTLAGELVLSRNQLNEALARQDHRAINSGAQRVSLVTSELQEVVTQTRMQPVGNLFAKFGRLVRDLSRELGKQIHLKLEGGEVEIDKTILEGLSDPLTHMVRNAVDHGIEAPGERTAAGKPRAGTVTLKALHQAGQVVIEISDDGKGLAVDKIAASSIAKGLVTREQLQNMPEREKMALIFLPGVSTAQKVSDVSGRGVGMDVVKTNLDRLGGKIEIDSTPGHGSRFRIKLPLTLAIIPSLLVSDGGERFAIPQVNVGELIRIPKDQIADRVGRVGDARVLNLRSRLVPLLYLCEALGTRAAVTGDRAMNVVMVDAGGFEYGLVVEELHDTVEIVVKPLGRHVKSLQCYAGATILGDGRVALILDVAGLAAHSDLMSAAAEASSRQTQAETQAVGQLHSLLLFDNATGESCAVPIEHVSRIERVRSTQVQHIAGRRTLLYRGASLPLVTLNDVAAVGELSETQQWVVIVFERLGRPLGLLAAEPLDMVEATLQIDVSTLRQRGIAGSAVMNGRTLLLIDTFELTNEEIDTPRPLQDARFAAGGDSRPPTVLVADDSDFFRAQIQRLIETIGCRVLTAEDGQAAWEILQQHGEEVDLLATDIEMPRMDGLGLTKQIRSDARFKELPIIALSSLAAEEEIARGLAAGVDEYQIKLNKDELIEGIRKVIARKTASAAAPKDSSLKEEVVR